MQIVIDIPEEVYKQIKGSNTIFCDDEKMCYEAVQNGTPLTESDDCVRRKEALHSICKNCEWYQGFKPTCINKCGSYKHIMKLPSVQPKRDKGEWKILDEEANAYECSKCQDAFMLIDGNPENNNYNFCPNYGADMRGEK